ncbi:hypothetical protein B0I00_2835 [Novosphingobium kunmingense]|uniref:Uncharacterized protein n=1 Tax=Novosphingobium kunmingense TaxID=1211806 RepID=A0A2N0H5J3_9SPHN|nr:hypothetical protein [Novosphingobium kunmingense]PKB14203.1 hypothetical protein B0I00_2835 [Novosphingobium kunmingense]
MRLVMFETQGESHTAAVNPDQVAFLAQGLYGTSIHFGSGEYVICTLEIEDVAARLSASGSSDDYLIATSAAPAEPS